MSSKCLCLEQWKNRKKSITSRQQSTQGGAQQQPHYLHVFLQTVRFFENFDCKPIGKCLCSQTCATPKKYSRSREGFWKGRGSKASYWSNLRPCAFCMHYRRQNHCNSLMNGQCGARQKRENANICVQGAALEGRPARPRQAVKTSVVRLLFVFRTFFNSKRW